MKVFKFGGASVKDATGIKNVVEVLKQVGHQQTVMVVSAMGKTTNAMEVIVNNSLNMKYSRKYLPPIPLKYGIIFFVNDNYSVILKNQAKIFC